VPEGKYLLKKNKVVVKDAKLDSDEVSSILRQNPNFKTAGIKLKLAAFNMFDSTAVAEKRSKKNDILRSKNKHKLERQDRINKKRIEKAKAKGNNLYTQKSLPLKDTINPKMFLREWIKYKVGEAPVIFDSLPYTKAAEQYVIYLRKKGFYYGSVKDTVIYHKNRKAVAMYELTAGPRYIIDSVYVTANNSLLVREYNGFVKEQDKAPLIGEPFDSDKLDDYRTKVARNMRDNAIYGFSSSHITYLADTNKTTMKVVLGIEFSDRLVRSEFDKDSLVKVKHRTTLVKNVYFHISDTTYFEGNFKETVEGMGLTLLESQFLRTLDTLVYAEIKLPGSDDLDPKRKATFLYNGEMEIDPGLLELQNYLEEENYYKEYYLERSYTRLLQLGLFQAIKPVIREIPGTKYVDMHYYLVPAKRQTFGFEPRFTNSNGFLGVQSSLNYTNKNLFGGGEKMIFEFGGGFESQPPVFDENVDGESIGRSFNTFEIGPSLKFDVPGLFPTKVTMLSKRQRPRTVISTAYNYQNRPDFQRHVFQLNYLWRFYVSKTQIFQAGLPFASIVKFVSINKDPQFELELNTLNDLFLRNAYSDQFIWQDWKLSLEYNNKDADNKKGKSMIYLNSSFDPAGNTLSLFKKYQDTVANGQHSIFGVGYSQFVRLDNDLIYSYPFTKKQSVHLRMLAGFGIPYGNSATSLPYDYSFFAGGANDNRGWKARQLGPGSYKYYLDPNRTATQIGDLRLQTSAEFRFSMGDMIKGALFADAGNIWTYKEDVNRPGSQISSDWYKEIAFSAGAGLRVDLDFFIIRLDVGYPLTNPAMPGGEKWFFKKDRPLLDQEVANYMLLNPTLSAPPKPFIPNIHFGIGYPF
jgi:outer membrane protein insertion porin family